MIAERKSFGTIDSNSTRVQPSRAAKNGHKWLANRQQKSEQIGATKLPQHRTYLQHLAYQQSQKHDAASKKDKENCMENDVSTHIVKDSFKNLKQSEKYSQLSYQNKNCAFRVPLQTLPFGNAGSSALNLPLDNKKHKSVFFPPVLDASQASQFTSCVSTDSDVSLQSLPDDDLSESFLNKSQSGRKSRKSVGSAVLAQNNPSHVIEIVEEYLPDILSYLRETEMKYKPKENYLEKQAEVTPAMRVKLIDWLIEVQDEYKLHNETLYLAVAFVDRFLSEMSVTRAKLQLLGTASMFLAAKIEEIYPPDANEFAYVTADTYTRSEVLLMERMILNVFGCALAMPTPFQYLTIFLEKSNLDESGKYLAHYLSEMTLLDEKYLCFRPSIKAATALTLSILTLRYSRYCDFANGNLDSQESTDSCMNVENGSPKSVLKLCDSAICSTIRNVMSDSIQEIYQCVLSLAESHLQESNSSHFLREKYATSAQNAAAKIVPLLADATMSTSCFLSWENVQEIWFN